MQPGFLLLLQFQWKVIRIRTLQWDFLKYNENMEANMVFLELVEALAVFLIIGLTITQVIIPILMGRPTFPIFKWKNKAVDHALAEAKEGVDLAKKKKQVKALQAEIDAEEKGR